LLPVCYTVEKPFGRKAEKHMHDELTEVDIRKMQEELDYRIRELRPQLIEEVQTTRAFGDLSENYEYKCAKQAKKSLYLHITISFPRQILLGTISIKIFDDEL
jgi:hypothetical protein